MMNDQERTQSVSIPSPEMLRLAKADSDLLRQYLQTHATACLKLGGSEDQEIILPDSILQLVCEALASAASGKKLRLVEEDEEVSPEKAAAFLQVSRPYLVRLLDQGEIPFHYVGTHRRITMSELIAYRQRRKIKSKAALQRMTELSEDMGLYDE
ncbi:MAG: DNA-binding protein [Candidatus Entotheonella factor]|uniref:DNA-binding protein n=1 Tax=Entotheonella factor TaxID=1429438 RepID=W4LDW6_ENTF1|nr:MAG: DNA-binding protein [Candidatus Entotheonella factor]